MSLCTSTSMHRGGLRLMPAQRFGSALGASIRSSLDGQGKSGAGVFARALCFVVVGIGSASRARSWCSIYEHHLGRNRGSRGTRCAAAASFRPGALIEDSLDTSLAPRLRAAISVVTEAGKLTKSLQARVVAGGLDAQKEDDSVVTVGDFAAQALVLSRLALEFPDDGFIAEEASEGLRSQPELLAEVLKIVTSASDGAVASEQELCAAIDLAAKGSVGQFTWVLDPIDGTRGFKNGEQYCIGLGLLDRGSPVLGVLGCPNDHSEHGRLFFAVRGAGAHAATPLLAAEGVDFKESRIQVSSRASASENIPHAILLEGPFTDHARNNRVQKALGSTTTPLRLDSMVKYGRLAAGEGDLILRLCKGGYREHIWDHAAGAVIVEEAGGCITDQNGKPLDFSLGKDLSEGVRGIIASSGGDLHPAALEALHSLD
mmetsp:Transcript_86621/g.278089  ORF Transcript_86621/g.278089 Transcript_86621/m.278089 type:complete len:430 (-) Transcript_86621:127-1416(-)